MHWHSICLPVIIDAALQHHPVYGSPPPFLFKFFVFTLLRPGKTKIPATNPVPGIE
jgi:hypothetical protein